MLCKKCGIELNIKNYNKNFTDIKGKRNMLLCEDCAEQIERELKEKYFVCEYEGEKIYCKDGKYVPYWGCGYYFKTLKGCKRRIENSDSAIIDPNIIDFLNDI